MVKIVSGGGGIEVKVRGRNCLNERREGFVNRLEILQETWRGLRILEVDRLKMNMNF